TTQPPDLPIEIEIDQPPLMPLPVVRDPRLKKIFVYTENVFAALNETDKRTISVQTPAFDLSGWLDLSRLRAGDVFETEVLVSLANRPSVSFARTRFDSPGLYCFADIAKGQNYISGKRVDIVLQQTASTDNFATTVEIAYQFVVESQ